MVINLNNEQRKIVEYPGDKFLSVQASPGSGKTRVLIEKVKYMLENFEEVTPESFLIITFSTDAAEELKERLIDGNIPAGDVQKMQISTIHAFCLDILEKTGNVGLDVIAEGEKLELFIKKHLDDLGFKNEASVSNYDISKIIDKYNEFSTFKLKKGFDKYIEERFPVDEDYKKFVIEFMKDNDDKFPSDEIKAIDAENGNTVFRDSHYNAIFLQIAKSYDTYLDLLEKENAIDYPQMQIKALEKMNEGYMPPYTNILIDEFQDTDPVQMDIFKKFIESLDTQSFTVVGDINQSIYGFRGSNRDFFKEIIETYPDKFEEYYLVTNYRSTEEIIDISQDFISNHYTSKNDLRDAKCGRKEFHDRKSNNNVYFMVNEDNKDEAKNIFNLINHIIDEGTIKNYSDIGILMRSVSSGSGCFKYLKGLFDENNIPYDVKDIGDLADSEELKYILTLMYHLIQEDDPYYTFVPSETSDWLNLKTLTGANKNKVLFELSEETKTILNNLQDKFENDVKVMDKIVCGEHDGWGSGIRVFNGIFNVKLDKRKEEVFSRVKKPILSDENLIEYGVTNENDLAFFAKLNKLKNEVNAEKYFDRPTISEVYFDLLTDITGYLTEDLVNNNESILKDLALITSSIANYEEVMYDRGLRGAFWFLKRTIKKYDSYKENEDAIQIMTVHKSKGLEFPVVILASVRDKGFPLEFRNPDPEDGKYRGKPVYYVPDKYLQYNRYEDEDIEKSHYLEEDRVLYVAKTRAEDELIYSIISENSAEDVERAINDKTPDSIKAISKGPERINDVIDDNLNYCELVNPDNIEINILEPKQKTPKEEIVNLSFTALQNYNECPLKYKLSNELQFNVSQKKVVDDGIFIHSALEIINKKIKVNNNEYIGNVEVAKTVEALFEKSNMMLKEEEREKYDKKLARITEDVIKYYETIGNELTILDSEYEFYLKDKHYALTGKIDLIYEKDGELGIIDYKNTSLVSAKYKEKYEKQLHMYLMALRDKNQLYNGHEIKKLNIYAIKYDGDKLIPFDVNEQIIDDLKNELEQTAIKIKNNEFKADCEDCGDCPYRKICKK